MGTAVPFCFVLDKGNKVRKTKGMGDLTKPKVKKPKNDKFLMEPSLKILTFSFFNFVT
jgi:hypothetical protein